MMEKRFRIRDENNCGGLGGGASCMKVQACVVFVPNYSRRYQLVVIAPRPISPPLDEVYHDDGL